MLHTTCVLHDSPHQFPVVFVTIPRIKEPDILEWALSQRPNSDCVGELLTNATVFVNRLLQHPISCAGMVLARHVKCNKAETTLEKDHNSRPYFDNVCLSLYPKYTDQPVDTFEGVIIDELHKVEILFEVNIIVQ